jgi:hypothetical protein
MAIVKNNSTFVESDPPTIPEEKKKEIGKIMRGVIKDSKNHIHVIEHPRGWAIVREGANRSYKVYREKTAAVSGAKKLARKMESSVVIHGPHGYPVKTFAAKTNK